MPEFSFVILYVESPPVSASFYAGLLGRPPIEQSPTFAMLALRDGVMLGLWSRDTVQPGASGGGGGAEVAFTTASPADVDATYDDWRRRGLAIVQSPVDLDFGRTFVALDPDGHRLRVFAPSRP